MLQQNSAVMSFVEVVLFSEVPSVLKLEGNQLFGTLKSVLVERSIILCPYLGGSSIGGLTVQPML